MPVPDARIEFQIGGAWVDVTDDVTSAGRIKHSRGRAEGASRVDPGSASFTVLSPGGKYSNRNPNSPYFGLLGRNTPARLSVPGPSYLSAPGGQSDRAVTPDVAALDIVGDIDIRIEATLADWTATSAMELAGKFVIPGQKSWLLAVFQRRLYLYWTTNGTTELVKGSTADLPTPTNGHLAVRVTLDVNNGAAGHTLTFYTSDSISGTWTQLGDPVITAGTTSVFSSTAPLDVGAVSNVGFPNPTGQIHAFQLRNGIAGTVVANPDFTAQTAGATSFVDSAGRTWSMSGAATISDRHYRFNLSIPEWPPSWHVSGHNVKATLQASGTLRRLGQGAKALDSTLRRRIPSYGPLGYWPMEDRGDASQAASPIAGVRAMSTTGIEWGQESSLASSNPLPRLASNTTLSTLHGPAAKPASTLTEWCVIWMYRLDTINTTAYTVLRILGVGTVREWYIQIRDNLSRVIGRDSEGGTVFTQDIGTSTDLYNQWVRVKFAAKQNGGNVDWTILWTDVGGDSGYFSTSFAGTVGRPTSVNSPPGGYAPALDGMSIGHISVWGVDSVTPYVGAVDAWTGETAGARITRLGAEEGIPVSVRGTPSTQALMGEQFPSPFLTLLGECEASDHGILYEDRDSTALLYRDRDSLYNQTPVLTVPYAKLAPPLEPVDDDQQLRNDVTVQRINGSSGRVVITEGPLSTASPPLGVGLYDESVSLSLHTDDQPVQIAGWRAHLGTWDEARYPSVCLYLHRHPELIEQVLALDVGDLLRITDLPPFLPPGPLDLMVTGYREEIGPLLWIITFFCAPARPWSVPVADTAEARADIAGAQLASGVTTGATTFSVATTSGPVWVNSAGYASQFPFDVLVGGEVVSVTAITGTSSPQSFTVTRSVNGISKSHLAATPIVLADPVYIAL